MSWISSWRGFNAIIIFIFIVEVGVLYFKNMLDIVMPWGGVVLLIFIAALIIANIYGKLSDNTWASISAVLLIIIMTIAGLFAPKGVNYIVIFASMLLFFMVLGILVNNRLPGILIDERNQMSLSRFQIVVWTAIILSAYLAIALSRTALGMIDALNIGMEWQLWALLGISTVSLVGSPLLLSEEKNVEPTQKKKEHSEILKTVKI